MFINITEFSYIRHVNFNVQILNDIKYHEKGFCLVIIKIPKNKYHYTILTIILYTTKLKKHNNYSTPQTLQPNYNLLNLGTKMVKNHNRNRKENKSWNWIPRKSPVTTRLHYNWNHKSWTTKDLRTRHH